LNFSEFGRMKTKAPENIGERACSKGIKIMWDQAIVPVGCGKLFEVFRQHERNLWRTEISPYVASAQVRT